MMMEEAERSGSKLDEVYYQVTEILPQIRLLYELQEGELKWIGDGVVEVGKKLDEVGALIKKEEISHEYPHCWRCKNPIIFRSTEQWFISMEKNGLRKKALEAIEKVVWTPVWGKDRIYGMIENRPDWCISRQRAWGVPIIIFYCDTCGHILADQGLINHVAEIFEKEGTDAWFGKSPGELLPSSTGCPECGGTEFRKETDILDVWFDSGVSYAAVCERRRELKAPPDMYLEGSDQHRGWFHSSLLASVGTRGIAPYHEVLTHGFVVDGKGEKTKLWLAPYYQKRAPAESYTSLFPLFGFGRDARREGEQVQSTTQALRAELEQLRIDYEARLAEAELRRKHELALLQETIAAVRQELERAGTEGADG